MKIPRFEWWFVLSGLGAAAIFYVLYLAINVAAHYLGLRTR